MAKFCPNCGTEVKEGFKFCLSCGAQMQAKGKGSKAANDTVDPKSFEEQAAAQPGAAPAVQPQQQPMPPPAMPQQGYGGQTQTYAPMQPKKSNAKLIGGIIGIVVAVVVILVVVILLTGGNLGFLGGSSGDLVGTWNIESVVMDGESQTSSGYLTLDSDGTYVASGDSGTWEVRNGKLYITSSVSGSSPFDDIGLDYQVSGNRLTLSFSGTIEGEYHTMTMIFTKS